MNGQDEIEMRLINAMAITPSAEMIRRLDDRVAAILAAPTARSGPSGTRRFLRPMVLAAALALAAGAVGAAVGLINRLAEEASPGWATAWERAEVIGVSQTDAGVTLTLERAYVDVNQAIVGITIDGLDVLPAPSDGTRNDELLSWVTEIRGPDGWRSQPEESSNTAAVVEGGQSAFLFSFGSPPSVAGPWEFSVTSVGYGEGNMTEGTWDFAFELPDPEGTVVVADAVDTVGQATLRLTELRIAPSALVARIALEVAGSTVVGWSPGTGQDGEVIRLGDETFQIDEQTLYAATPDENAYRTSVGVDDPAGTWQIVIPELWYTDGDGRDVNVVGPWTLEVTVP